MISLRGISSRVLVSTSPLNSVPVIVLGAALALLIVGYGSRRVFDDRITTVGVTAGVGMVIIVVVGEGITPGVVLRPLSVGVGRVTPLIALVFAGLLAYYVYIRWVQPWQEKRARQSAGSDGVIVLRRGDD